MSEKFKGYTCISSNSALSSSEQTSPGLTQTTPGLAQTTPGLAQTTSGLTQTTPCRAQTTPGLAQTTVSPVTDDLLRMVEEKARGIFALCDCEGKGFITKQDMRRLATELPLESNQLDEVFDKLDVGNTGCLTQEAFSMGFGNFLGLSEEPPSSDIGQHTSELTHYVAEATETEDEEFCELLKSFGAYNVLDDVSVVKSIWIRLNRSQPEVVNNFEDLLRRISVELNKKHMDYHQLQISLRNKTSAHDEEMERMYEEMERLLDLEKQQLRSQERVRERQLEETKQKELQAKDERLREIIIQQEEMSKKLAVLNMSEAQARQENQRLAKEKEAIEEMLDHSHHRLQRSRSQVEQLRRERSEEKKRRVIAAAQISEWISLERESLVKQLQVLKEMNKRLRDDDDEEDEDTYARTFSPKRNLDEESLNESVQQIMSGTRCVSSEPSPVKNLYTSTSSYWWDESDRDVDDLELRQQPIGATTGSLEDSDKRSSVDSQIFTEPSRIFKVVFIGDSGVGKTCFLNRVCHKSFADFSATIGVDFQVHNLRLDDEIVALQLWDTAGQERFRSITKQYYRKADGVLLIYDVTSESSFKNVRDWLDNIKETVDESTLVALIGNKIDLPCRSIPIELAARLAMENSVPYFETSAKTGDNISETIYKISSLLREREVKQMENSVQLTTTEELQQKKNKCCDS